MPSFNIEEGPKYFLINYSENNLLPILNKFFTDMNRILSEKIKKTINNNSLEIENVIPLPFKNKAKEIFDDLFDNYINYIKTGIIEYGETESDYKNNLDRIIEQNQDNFRRIRLLDEYTTEEQFAEENKKRLESKYVEESLELMINKTRNVKQYIDTLNAFTETEQIIRNYKNILNVDYRRINTTIELNRYNDEINKYLKEKLSNLTKILSNYYDSINSTFSELKNEIKNSINSIKYSLDTITEITKETLNGRYQRMSDSTNRINKNVVNYIEKYDEKDLKYTQKSENMLTTVTAGIKKLNEYVEFKLDFTLEGEKFKIPKIKSKIVDIIVPKNVQINVLYSYIYTSLFSPARRYPSFLIKYIIKNDITREQNFAAR